MSWITVDTKLPNHAKIAALPSDAARWGWLVTLCEAKEQTKPGTFASERHYRHALPRQGRYLSDYIKAGLMDRAEEGTLQVHDWQRHQWAVSKAQQRETSLGQDEDKTRTSLGQKEDASRAVSVSVPVSVLETEGVQGEPDAVEAVYRRTGEVPGPKIRTWINQLSETHGEQRVIAKVTGTPLEGRTIVEYLRAVRDQLRLEDVRAERQERADEAQRVAANHAPLRALPPATDISEAEAKRLAAEYAAEARR